MKYITRYPVDGNNAVTNLKYVDGKVYINDTQYFDGVPEIAWNFYISGYQPAQKWLKDRKVENPPRLDPSHRHRLQLNLCGGWESSYLDFPHRSIHGFIINVFAAIGAYHFLPKKPSIASQFETYQSSTLQLSL